MVIKSVESFIEICATFSWVLRDLFKCFGMWRLGVTVATDDKFIGNHAFGQSFQEVCKKNADLQSWDTDLKTHAEEILKTFKGKGGLSIDSWKPFTLYAWYSNKKIVQAILEFKEDITKGKGISKKKKRNEERVNILADKYIKNSSNMLDFLSEMENFLMLVHNSHSNIATVIQKYFKIHNEMSGAEFYGMITDKLKKLKDSDNTFDHFAENLLKKAVSLKSQHEEMIHNLQVEIIKLSKKEKHAKSWKNVAYMIFVGAVVVWFVWLLPEL
ncbi:UPF0496 protein At5g66675-like [Rosa chinensis]|uniref:UPF0496 protein At5g66675-like n=1 Tax=Rosa chinensis TaxID=74649 RepID=UPI001AD8A9F6|nr:UPF0496 protein At5g66675-like [Rosa chinensis]